MLFNSLEFCVFFPVVVCVYFACPYRFRWLWLLAASYFFYMAWEPGYAVLILFTSAVDYVAARMIGSQERAGSRRWVVFSLCTNFGLLFFFKYYNFFSSQIDALLALLGWGAAMPRSGWLLPVGISFYTFQSVSYTLDVYRGRIGVERHPGYLALYVAFFPQLVAGPIERAGSLIPQLRASHDFEYGRVTDGLKLMVWGLFKKAVVADRLAQAVDYVYADPSAHGGPALVLATLFFAVQIYCDFSGYSDIAIGAAQVMGIRLMDNFRQPYLAISMADFWRRWHISLSTWFRDYLYVPLGGNRASAGRWAFNILVVFLLSGLWHGASWTFVLWGFFHGICLVCARGWRALRGAPKEDAALLVRALRVFYVFVLVNIGWVLFRAESIGDAVAVFSGFGRGWAALGGGSVIEVLAGMLRVPRMELVISLALIGVVAGEHLLREGVPVREWLGRRPAALRWLCYSALLWAIFLFGVFQQREFIYFVF